MDTTGLDEIYQKITLDMTSQIITLLRRMVDEFSLPQDEYSCGTCCYCYEEVGAPVSHPHKDDCAWLASQQYLQAIRKA